MSSGTSPYISIIALRRAHWAHGSVSHADCHAEFAKHVVCGAVTRLVYQRREVLNVAPVPA